MDDPPSPTGVGPPIVVCADEQDDVDIDAARWGALAEAVLRAEGVSGELTLTFVDRAEIAALNSEHMGASGPTDVLSFPLDVATMNGSEPVDGTPVLLGDVVVCPAIAAAAPMRPVAVHVMSEKSCVYEIANAACAAAPAATDPMNASSNTPPMFIAMP